MGRGRILVYVLIFTALTINYIDRVVLSVAAPQIVKDFGLSTIELGYLFSAFLWTYLAFVLPWGVYIDRAGTRVSTANGMAIWSVATLLTGMSWNFGVAFFTRLLMGFGEASTYPAGARTIREWSPAGERGVATTVFTCGGYVGAALGSILMGFVVSAYGWRVGFFVAGALGFIWLIAWLVCFRQPETATFIGEDERRKILNERGGDTVPGTAAPVSALLKCRSIWGTFVTQGCAVYTVYLFLTWLPTYLQATRGLTILKSGFYTAVPYAVAVPGTILIGLLSDRLLRGSPVESGRRRTLVAIMMLCSSGILLTPWITDTTVLLAVFSISLTSIGGAVGLNIALLNDLLRNPANIGRANGILGTGANLVGLAAPIVTGYVVSGTGNYDYAFLVAGVLLFVGASVCLVFTRNPIAPEEDNARAELAYKAAQ